MNYKLFIIVGPDGIPSVELFGGELPPGQFTITGVSDTHLEKIQVQRRDAHGRYAVSAEHSHPKHAFGPTPADAPLPAVGPSLPGDGTEYLRADPPL